MGKVNKFKTLQVVFLATLVVLFSTFALTSNTVSANNNVKTEDPSPTTEATLTPSPAPTDSTIPTSTPSDSPKSSHTPNPTATPFVFPMCQNVLPTPGDVAHYPYGIHQIVGGPLLIGSDDVYSLEGGNFLQCFCPAEGFDGIQTNWLRSKIVLSGWFFEYGVQWNLGPFYYAAQNVSFRCGPQESPTPTPFDFCPNLDGVQTALPSSDWYKNNPNDPGSDCRQFQYGGPESAHRDNPGTPVVEGYGTGGQVLGASTMGEAGSFTEGFYQAIMALGATISTIGAKGLRNGRKTAVKSRRIKKVALKSRKKTSKKG